MGASSGRFDLLGDPIPDGWGGRGRPPHIPTTENRNKVIVLQAVGRTDDEIAAALGISKPTLRKHYFSEMKSRTAARFRVEAAMLTVLMTQAGDGSVPAIKELDRHLERARRREIERQFADRPDEPMGKKAAADAAAMGAGLGTEWGDDLISGARSLQ